MRDLEKKEGARGNAPSPKDKELYLRLDAVKKTLEWVHSRLIKTTAKRPDRFMELAGYKHYVLGPTHDQLYP